MKILITSREALFPNIGGHREYLLETIKGLIAYGNTIDVLSWGSEENYTYNEKNINEYHFNSESDKLSENNNLKFIKDFASSIGIGQIHTIKHKGLDIRYGKNLLNDYDIIIKNGPDSNGIANFIGSKLQIPVIERLDWVGLPYRSKYYKLWLNYIDKHYMPYNYFNKYFDAKITKLEAKSAKADFVYTHTKTDMLKISTFIEKNKVDYIYPFLYAEVYKERENPEELINGKYILFYSTPSINSYEAIKYIYKISRLHQEIKFVITGNFENLKTIFSRENLIFLGELPIEKFYEILNNAYFVILPLTKGHGIQMKLIRAFSFSKAVIANDGILKPISDLVNDNEDIIIGYKPLEFLDKLLYLYEDESLVEQIGSNSYKLYLENFSPDKNIKKLAKYLESCKNKYEINTQQ